VNGHQLYKFASTLSPASRRLSNFWLKPRLQLEPFCRHRNEYAMPFRALCITAEYNFPRSVMGACSRFEQTRTPGKDEGWGTRVWGYGRNLPQRQRWKWRLPGLRPQNMHYAIQWDS